MSAPESWDAAQRARLLQVIRRALLRAADAAGGPERAVQVRDEASRRPSGPAEPRNQTRPAPRERVEAQRLLSGEGFYGVPSYDDAGKAVAVPARSTSGPEEEGSGEFDQLVEEAFPETSVAMVTASHWLAVGGGPYVITTHLARAMQFGGFLFGARGYAVLHRRRGAAVGRYYVVGLTETVRVHDLGGLDESFAAEGVAVAPVRSSAELVSSRDYETVLVVTSDGSPLVTAHQNHSWNLGAIHNAIRRGTRLDRQVDPRQALEWSRSIIESARKEEYDESEAEVVAKWNRTIFAAMPFEKRAEYLEKLLGPWMSDERKEAVIEIIRASRNTSELDALFAILRQKELFDTVFHKLDSNMMELLQAIADFRVGGDSSWKYVLGILVNMGLVSVAPELAQGLDPLTSLENAVLGVKDWLASTYDGIKLVLTHPADALEGLGHLAELAWTFQRAQSGDRDAIRLVAQMCQQAAAAVVKALHGLQYAEELGRPYGQRATGARVASGLLQRLSASLVFEVLTWFIGVGEIKAAITAAGELPARLAGLAKVLQALSGLAKVGEVSAEAAHFERVLMVLARAAEIVGDARVTKLVELLPESHLAALQRVTEAVKLSEGADLAALRAAAHGKPALLADMDRVAAALKVVDRFEAKAAMTKGVTREMVEGLHTLFEHYGKNQARLALLMDRIPAPQLEEFMGTLRFINPDHVVRWGLEGLLEVSQRPAVMALVREGGSELLNVAISRAGKSWEALDPFLEGLALRRTQIGDPAEYARFLGRLRAGDAAAFGEVREARHAAHLAKAVSEAKVGEYAVARLREGGRTRLLEDLEGLRAEKPALFGQRAGQLARLSDKELDGLNEIAKLTTKGDISAWDTVLDTVLGWDAGSRADILELMADIGPHTEGGLERVIHSIFGRSVKKSLEIKGVTGSFGELFAARTLIQRYGATSLRFQEVAVEASGALRRDVDIVAELRGRSVHVEIKTNLEGTASRDLDEMRRDLVRHAPQNYDTLLYLYHPSVQGQLEGVGRTMRRLLDDPEVVKLFHQRSLNREAAKAALDRWLAGGGISSYSF